jgi:hypothetical protein
MIFHLHLAIHPIRSYVFLWLFPVTGQYPTIIAFPRIISAQSRRSLLPAGPFIFAAFPFFSLGSLLVFCCISFTLPSKVALWSSRLRRL